MTMVDDFDASQLWPLGTVQRTMVVRGVTYRAICYRRLGDGQVPIYGLKLLLYRNGRRHLVSFDAGLEGPHGGIELVARKEGVLLLESRPRVIEATKVNRDGTLIGLESSWGRDCLLVRRTRSEAWISSVEIEEGHYNHVLARWDIGADRWTTSVVRSPRSVADGRSQQIATIGNRKAIASWNNGTAEQTQTTVSLVSTRPKTGSKGAFVVPGRVKSCSLVQRRGNALAVVTAETRSSRDIIHAFALVGNRWKRQRLPKVSFTYATVNQIYLLQVVGTDEARLFHYNFDAGQWRYDRCRCVYW